MKYNLDKLTIHEWQKWFDRYRAEAKNPVARPCFRIDGTQFSTARHYGGFTMNGSSYTVFYFDDGALLACEMSFIKWICDQMKAGKKKVKTAPQTAQGELPL